MKENKYLRIKIYIFILLASFAFGWMAVSYQTNSYHTDRYIHVFNYAAFSIGLATGFGITLLYDVFVFFRSRNKL